MPPGSFFGLGLLKKVHNVRHVPEPSRDACAIAGRVRSVRDNEERVLVDEQWVSRELRLLIAAHYSDSRTGTTDYWLTNLRRDEPSSELFMIPYDYTLLDPRSAGATEDPWSINYTPERYVVELAAGRLKP